MADQMRYVPSSLPAELSGTTLAVAWRAADIYATRPESADAISEAAAELAAAAEVAPEILRMQAIAVTDAACLLASSRVAPHRRPRDQTVWADWQSTAAELWPILADAAGMAYTLPLPPSAVAGHYAILRRTEVG